MKFAAIRDLQIKASSVVEEAQKQPVVITVYGKPRAVLTQLSEEDLEDFIFENSPIIRRRIQRGLREIRQGKVTSHDALKAKLLKRKKRGSGR